MNGTFIHRALRWGGACLAALGLAQPATAAVQGIGTLGASETFNLIAADGHISAADGVQIYMWGFGEAAKGTMQYVGPTLKVKQGATVTVNLTNNLEVPTSIVFGGQTVTATGGGDGVLAREAAARGGTVSYTFTATQPGTYLYQSGTQPGLQVEMGLVGALVVYPADGTGAVVSNQAYGHTATAYDRETLVMVSEADSDIHLAVDEQVQACKSNNTAPCNITVDLAKRFPKYWFINGRTAPDTLAGNFIGELPLQPYNCLPRVHPGERMLLRTIGAGSDLHPMHHHGNNSWAIARDGRMLSTAPATAGPDLALSDYTIQVVPGQTYDAIWSWTGAGLNWDIYGCTTANCGPTDTNGQPIANYQSPGDRGKPLPVKLPTELEVAFGEFYSGSPYLGFFGVRPPGAGFANTSGGYFHMFHSHNEREVVNGGIYPGGMMTMVVIEPPNKPIAD